MDLLAVRVLEGTKISHDYKGNNIDTFSYRDLINRGVPSIGIPCKQNNLIVIDVDVAGAHHKNDGREWWANFAQTAGVPPTYTVITQSGGYHFYFRLPESVNPETFSPPSQLAPGVDIKWRGWVGAPPTAGYQVAYGDITTISVAPPSLMAEIARLIQDKGNVREFDLLPGTEHEALLDMHRPFTDAQIKDLYNKIEWIQTNASMSRSEWRDGLFAIKAGCHDRPDVMNDLATKWTYNQSYSPGDEYQALEIVDRANPNGKIGPGTIFSIIKDIRLRSGAVEMHSPFGKTEILDRAKVPTKLGKDMSIIVPPTESNMAAILGVMFSPEEFYHDLRQDQFMFKGQPTNDTDLVNKITPLIQSETYGLGLSNFSMSTIAAGVDILMNARQVDPHVKWLNGLVWDGISRIDTFFPEYVGVEDSEYIRAVGKNFWISMAARGLRPGIKFDSMVVLEGHEGIRKSSLVEAIGGEYTFTPSTDKLMNDTDELRKMHQSIIVELPELMGLIHQDSNKVKAFLSKPFDHIRALFAKRAVKRNRGFVFVGTTNNSKYLSADMGYRRFWPVVIPKSVKTIELWKVQADREQLFAEAVVRFKNGESFHEVPNHDHKKAVISRNLHEPLLGVIDDITYGMGNEFRVAEIYTRLSMGGFLTGGLNAYVSKRIEDALKSLGAVESVSEKGPVWHRKKTESLDSFI